MKFPVWRTTLEVFEFLGRERSAMVRFGTPPVIIIFLVSMALQVMLGEEQWEQITSQGVTAIVQGLILLPVTVMWYRLTVIGESEIAGRPLLSFGAREWRLLGWQLLILVIVAAVGFVCAAITIVLTELNQEQESIAVLAVNIVWTIGWLLSLLLLLTRLSMVLVLAALDQPVSLKVAWRMTEGLSWRLLGATVLIALAALTVAALFKLVGFIVGTITAIATGSMLSEILQALNVLGQTVGGLISLLGIATLFGFVYKTLANFAEASVANLQTKEMPDTITATKTRRVIIWLFASASAILGLYMLFSILAYFGAFG